MRTPVALLIFLVAVAGVSACGGVPPPTQHMANAEAGIRAAREVGAQGDPQGALHLSLAQEEFDRAKAMVGDGDNQRADYLLSKAEADADLALAEAREAQARAQAQQAKEQIKMLKNARQ
jgi:uncharacterized protein YqfA (UPF0365 family)